MDSSTFSVEIFVVTDGKKCPCQLERPAAFAVAVHIYDRTLAMSEIQQLRGHPARKYLRERQSANGRGFPSWGAQERITETSMQDLQFLGLSLSSCGSPFQTFSSDPSSTPSGLRTPTCF